jgi:hypothetical protein
LVSVDMIQDIFYLFDLVHRRILAHYDKVVCIDGGITASFTKPNRKTASVTLCALPHDARHLAIIVKSIAPGMVPHTIQWAIP